MLVLLFERPKLLDPLAVIFRLAVAEVEAKDVGAGLEQLAQPLERGSGGPKGGDDLGETLSTHGPQSTSFATTL